MDAKITKLYKQRSVHINARNKILGSLFWFFPYNKRKLALIDKEIDLIDEEIREENIRFWNEMSTFHKAIATSRGTHFNYESSTTDNIPSYVDTSYDVFNTYVTSCDSNSNDSSSCSLD